MAVVVVPSQWRTSLGGAQRVEVAAASVGELIAVLQQRWPELRPWLDNGLGGLPEYLNVFVGEADVRVLQDLETPLRATDEVRFILIMAGGAGEEVAWP